MSTVTRRGCASHKSSSRLSGKQNMQLPPAPPHHVLCSGPVFPLNIGDQQSHSAWVSRAGYTEGGKLGQQGRAGAPSCISPEGSPAHSGKHSASFRMEIMCVGSFAPVLGTTRPGPQTGACRDIVLGKRSHLSELPGGIELRRLW